MALIHCNSCKKIINDKVLSCPYCGTQRKFSEESEESREQNDNGFQRSFYFNPSFQIRRLALLGGFSLLALFLGALIYCFILMMAAFVGLKLWVGGLFAFFILMGICYFGFSKLAIPVFAFFGALNAWEWPWYCALVFAMPGVVLAMLFMIPSLYVELKYMIQTKFFRR